jgi:autophagy-related protein 2
MFSLPSLGLPTNVQNRLLSFLLRRLLGHLVVGGQVQLDRIDADLTRGKLVLGHVDLEAEVRISFCLFVLEPNFPLTRSRSIQALSAYIAEAVPFEVDSGSVGRLELSLSTARVDVNVSDVRLSLSSRAQGHPPPSPRTAHAHHVSPLENSTSELTAELAESFLQEDLDDETRESIHSAAPLAASSSFGLPGSFGISTATDIPPKEEVTYLASLVEKLLSRVYFNVSDIRVSIVSDDGCDLELRIDQLKFGEQSPVVESGIKTATVSGVRVFMRQGTSPAPAVSTAESSDVDSSDDMAMSRAIADLRESLIEVQGSPSSSDEEFLSAGEEEQGKPPTREQIPQSRKKGDDWMMIGSLGSEDLVVVLDKTIRQLSISLDYITALLLPQQLRSLASLASRLSSSQQSTTPPAETPSSTKAPFNLTLSIKSLTVALATDQVDGFWERPHSALLPPGSIRFRLDKLSATRDNITILDLSLHESLATPPSQRHVPSRYVPLLIFDHNLPYQYSRKETSFPSFEMSDWLLTPSEKGSKVRRARGSRGESHAAFPAVDISLADRKARFQPMHVFVDVGVAERISVWTDVVKAATAAADNNNPKTGSSQSTKSPEEASSFPRFDLAFDMVRIDARCPPPPDKKVEPPALLRSGILTLDMYGIRVKSGSEKSKGKRKSTRFGDDGGDYAGEVGGGYVDAEFDNVIFFFTLAQGEFLSLG